MPRYFAPTIPGSLGNRQGSDATTNRLESETARQLALPRPDLNRIVLKGDDGQSFSNGLMVSAALTIGANTVAHGLGRTPIGVNQYHTDASGYAPGYVYANKNGNQTVTEGSWTTITTWTETDPYGAFDNATGIWTCPRTGIYSMSTSLLFNSIPDAGVVALRIRNITTGIGFGTWVNQGAAADTRVTANWFAPVTRSDTVAMQIYLVIPGAGTTAVLNAAADGSTASLAIVPCLGVDCYSFDATNIYVHSDYEHTRSFWVF